jgi:hypothetical protein
MGSVKLRTILGLIGAYEKISVIRYPENEVFRADVLELFSDRRFEIYILVDPKTND